MFRQLGGFESPPRVAGLQRWQSSQFLLDHLKNANLQRQGSTDLSASDMVFGSNEAFWQQVMRRSWMGLRWVKLENFQITDWFPRTPGLYHTGEAQEARHEAERYVTQEGGIEFYEPRGKLHMIQGGIGSVRFKPITLEYDDYWLCTATSDRFCHSGIPLAVPNHLMERLGFEFIYRYDITGQIRFLPDFLERHFYHMSRIPQIYVLVDHIEHQGEHKSAPIRITPMVFFTGGRHLGLSEDGNVTYVTCRSDSLDELDRASEWVARYAHRYDGQVITNYDQQRPVFEDAPFSLQKVMNGNIRGHDLRQFHIQQAEIVVDHVNQIHMEYATMTKIDVKLDNTTIHGNFVVANSIKNSFNQAHSADIPDDLKTTLKDLTIAVGKMSENLQDETAKQVARDLETLTAEATSSSPRKQWWELSIEGLKKAAKDVGEIGKPVLEMVAKLVPILLGASA